MTSIIKKFTRLRNEHGLSGLVQAVSFKFLTSIFHIPSRKIAVFNGIAVRGTSLYSKIDIFPEHEVELIAAIRKYIKNGEKVLVIGGGSGASTVVVAHQVGNTGSVITYEGNLNSVNVVKDTINLNKVNDRVIVNHTIVEEPVHLMGELKNASTLAAKDFPDCDVLVMDCEGAELPILKNIKIKPRLIIVETHPMFNSPKSKIIPLLNKLDYEIISSDARREFIDVLAAKLK